MVVVPKRNAFEILLNKERKPLNTSVEKRGKKADYISTLLRIWELDYCF